MPNIKNHTNDKFKYRGKDYGVGTLYTIDGKNYYQFVEVTENGYYRFICLTPYIGSVSIYPPHIDKEDLIIIETKDIQSSNIKTSFYTDMTVGWIWYIIAMLISLLFKDWIYGWIGSTIVFISWKRNKENGGK